MFVRYPEPGRTKTRLIPTLGSEEAARIYKLMAEHVASVVASLDRPGLEKVVYFEPEPRREEIKEWMGEGFTYHCQPDADLGRRLANGFVWGFGKGAKRVVAIGTDCVELKLEILEESFDALEETDSTVGPALDGGYYLIGLRRFCASAFRGIPWSTERTLRETLARLRGCGLNVRILPPLMDIDDHEDLAADRSGLFR